MMRALVFAIAIVCALAGVAAAYPQFQLSKDQTCSSCHIAPEGGDLLNENGLNVAEQISQYGTDPAFINGVFKLPAWLMLGGDFRAATGYVEAPQKYLETFPMQADIYASAKFAGHFHVNLTVGYRPPEYGNEAATQVWSREHYIMWQQHADDGFGLFARVGRFMPIFGLRFAEHPEYTREYGGTPLYSETYGAAIEYIEPNWEAHLTGFIEDPIIDPVAHDNGVAAYAEMRPIEHASVGLEAMVTVGDDCSDCAYPHDEKYRGGVTGKYYAAGPGLELEGEVQFVNVHVETYGTNQGVGTIMLSKFLPFGVMADLALDYYNEDLRIKGVDREAVDLNVHWFTTSHVELLLTTRFEAIHGTAGENTPTGGPSGSYVLLQAHYRL
ncbi:MAG TPA: hypothetical protein VH143_09580 [Kofleriaceae bacterium]|nr:hypothetical protein [Kofleriaceae bacterium]